MDRELVDLLADLVRTPSMNPMGGDASREGYNEVAMAAKVADWLGGIGVEPNVQEVAPHRMNVWARTPTVTDEPAILFEAHMDTVTADTWAGDPFDPVIRDGFLHGRGSCDTKASLAAMLVALRRLMAEGSPRRPILFLAACDEESGFVGADAWAKLGIKAEFGVVGEPTEMRIVRAHKGVARWRLVTRGRSAHSSNRDAGVCAVTRMARVILCLERYYQETLRERTHEALGRATLSVGLIRGGQTVNTVPDRCEIEVDRRLLPAETGDEAAAEIARALAEDPDIDFDVLFEETTLEAPGLDTPLDSPAVEALRRACETVLGRAEVDVVPYGTDAPAFVRVGIPCVVFGPGEVGDAHSDHERVPLADVENASEVYLEVMRG